jgi:mannose-6-phosphate isomerase-like protein (cupin superfamily)
MSPDADHIVRLSERRLDADAEDPLHLHVRADESLLVLDGTVVVSVGDKRSVLTVGDAIEIPAGEVHAALPVRSHAVVLVAHRSVRPDTPVDVPADAWPVIDGLGTLLLGRAPLAAQRARATGALADRN